MNASPTRLRRTLRQKLRAQFAKPYAWSKTLHRDEQGSTLLEMALAGAVFFAVLFGVIQVSFAFYLFNFVSDAAREATRWAIVRGSTSCANTPNLSPCNATAADIKAFVQGLALPGSHSDQLAVAVNWWAVGKSKSGGTTWTSCTACNEPGNAVQVQVTYPFRLAIPFWAAPTVNLSSSSQMVIAQ